DQRAGIVQSFKRSWKITFKNVLKIFFFSCLNTLAWLPVGLLMILLWMLIAGVITLIIAKIISLAAVALVDSTIKIMVLLIISMIIPFIAIIVVLPLTYIYRQLSPREITPDDHY